MCLSFGQIALSENFSAKNVWFWQGVGDTRTFPLYLLWICRLPADHKRWRHCHEACREQIYSSESSNEDTRSLFCGLWTWVPGGWPTYSRILLTPMPPWSCPSPTIKLPPPNTHHLQCHEVPQHRRLLLWTRRCYTFPTTRFFWMAKGSFFTLLCCELAHIPFSKLLQWSPHNSNRLSPVHLEQNIVSSVQKRCTKFKSPQKSDRRTLLGFSGNHCTLLPTRTRWQIWYLPFCRPRCCAGSSWSGGRALSRRRRWNSARTCSRTWCCRSSRPTPSPGSSDGASAACCARRSTCTPCPGCTPATPSALPRRSWSSRWTPSLCNLQTQTRDLFKAQKAEVWVSPSFLFLAQLVNKVEMPCLCNLQTQITDCAQNTSSWGPVHRERGASYRRRHATGSVHIAYKQHQRICMQSCAKCASASCVNRAWRLGASPSFVSLFQLVNKHSWMRDLERPPSKSRIDVVWPQCSATIRIFLPSTMEHSEDGSKNRENLRHTGFENKQFTVCNLLPSRQRFASEHPLAESAML